MAETTFQTFGRYMDEMAAAERRRDYKVMWRLLERIEQLPAAVETQRWLTEYSRAVLELLYKPNSEQDKERVTLKLLELRSQVWQADSQVVYGVIKPYYCNMLVNVLQKNYDKMETMPQYEELAQELLKLLGTQSDAMESVEDIEFIPYGILGDYYAKQGRFAKSETYYLHIWEAVQHRERISVFTLHALVQYSRLLQNTGNFQQMQQVAVRLDEILRQELVYSESIEKNETLFLVSVQRLMQIFCFILLSTEHKDITALALEEFMSSRLISSRVGKDETLQIYGGYLCCLHMQKKKCSMWKRLKIGRFFRDFKRKPDFNKLSAWERSNFYSFCYYLIYMNNPHKAQRYLERMVQILLYEEFPERDRQPYLNNMITAIREYKELNRMQKVFDISEHMLRRLMEYYSSAEYYTDNEKLDSYLGVCKLSFQIAYLAVRELVSARKRMEYSMNFKNILSSVIRLRNLFGEKACQFPYFTMKQLMDKLPQDTAVIDFFYIEPQIYETGALKYDQPEVHYLLEVFVLAKQDDKIQFSHHELADAWELNQLLRTYRERLDVEGGKTSTHAQKIYQLLLAPIQESLKKISHLWICPDAELCNIPMELLIEAQKDWHYVDVVYWQSLRDIFEEWKDGFGDGQRVCSVGEPSFHIKEKQKKQEAHETQRSQQEEFVSLLYSGYEVKKIAEILGGRCFTQQKATKYVIEPGYLILHIATHGISLQGEENTWYRSRLAFAGISDFLETGQVDKVYGNGSLSAEEISRMNLAGTELVVLSACHSGNSIFSRLRQQTGLHVAFGAAGVKYIISALWRVDDLSTAVLMGYFYRNLLEECAIPEALRRAKEKLRDTTATQLIEIFKGDFQILGNAYSALMEQLESMPEDYCMYRPEFYWAGFVCYEFLN